MTALQPATLWHEFAAPLRAFVRKRAPREVDPDDLLQDVFVRIHEQLPHLREADRVDAWIFQIARNVLADAFRRRTRRDALADRIVAEAPGPTAVDDDDRAAVASLAGCLASMIAALPEPYRQAIELTELGGLTQAEAARQVGVSRSGMKSRVQRGRDHLQAIIRAFCRVETDVRGGVIECDPVRAECGASVRPSPGSRDSMGMSNPEPVKPTPSTPPTTTPSASGCCGGPAPEGASACCALDAEVKSSGGAGCGCGSKPATAPATRKGCC